MTNLTLMIQMTLLQFDLTNWYIRPVQRQHTQGRQV